MRPPGLVLLALLLSLAPLAGAAVGTGSQLEAAAPVSLDGVVDGLLPAGLASIGADGGSAIFAYGLQATELNVTYHTVAAACAPTPGPATAPLPGGCNPASPASRDDKQQLTLRGAHVTIASRPTGAYKALVTTDSSYRDTPSFGDAGRLVVTTAQTTKIDAVRSALSLDASNDAWGANPTHETEPIYQVDAGSSAVSASGVKLSATGGFESFLQGMKVRIDGTRADGSSFSQTYDTPIPKNGEPYRYLELEASGGALSAGTTGAFVAFVDGAARPVFDVRTRAHFEDANGTVVAPDGQPTAYEQKAATVEGPISLTLTKVVADKARLTFAIADGLHIQDVPTPDDQKPLDAGQLAAAGAAGAGGAGLLIAAAYFWPRLKFAGTLLLLPLYSRIERQDVLEHGKRDEIYELIRGSPGIHAHDIGVKTQIGWGTTVYHLKLLENHGLVVSKKSGRYKRFFVNTGEYTKKKDLYGALRNETAKAVAQYVVEHPGTSQKDLCAALSIQPSLASWHVEKLEGVGLVKRVKDGRQVRYFAGPAWADLNVRVPAPGADADTPAET